MAKLPKSEQRWALLWTLILVGLACLPYLLAWQLAPAEVQYTGLLTNPLDGESYYAKMQQGARGDWLFHLAFTPEPHEGAFIFTFYLALGHLAAALHLPIPLTYHLARAASALFFLLVAYRFIARFLEGVQARRAAFLLLGFSSGLGWLLAPFGITTADLWVTEGFTFLSILTNPHFPLAMGFMLLIFLVVLGAPPSEARKPRARKPRPYKGMELAGGETAGGETTPLLAASLLGLLLAVVQPFPVPVLLAVLAVYLAALAWQDHRLPWTQILITGAAAVGAAPILLYDLYVYRTNPALAAWAAQNLTPSLPPWNYALGYGLVLLLACVGIVVALRRRRPTDLFLLAWVGCAALLLYVPFALQRRFITGLHLPLTVLATLGLERAVWPRFQPSSRNGVGIPPRNGFGIPPRNGFGVPRHVPVTGLLVGLSALTNLFVPLVAVAGVAQGRQPLVMSQGEAGACAWLGEHTTWTDTVLAPPESGQFVPAWAGNRVVYGHPFETIDAKTKEAEAAHFFSPGATTAAHKTDCRGGVSPPCDGISPTDSPAHTCQRRALLDRYGVRYVLAPQETDLDEAALGLTQVWAGGDAVLYRVEARP